MVLRQCVPPPLDVARFVLPQVENAGRDRDGGYLTEQPVEVLEQRPSHVGHPQCVVAERLQLRSGLDDLGRVPRAQFRRPHLVPSFVVIIVLQPFSIERPSHASRINGVVAQFQATPT
jgi:hypothetical protein